MSECRCDDITACQGQISRLEEALEELAESSKRLDTIEEDLVSLADKSVAAYEVENEEKLKKTVKKSDDDLRAVKSGIVMKINGKIEEIKTEIETMQTEDTAFHEEEALAMEEGNASGE
ncbi:MAG: hypothetical protein E7284_08615 [Lachnospiraceae bacterium]|nr:hypothetical protein [Lachnospiraceae bacterium]